MTSFLIAAGFFCVGFFVGALLVINNSISGTGKSSEKHEIIIYKR